ncbi:plastocyanin [Streptomyces sp. URMC 127]|uniref:plastocyanin n=1 Tax=Streptomyces sp. URMC 127 TaxID=3423402 RepID=UPI003F19E3E6
MSTQHTVRIQNFAFVPNELIIEVGDSVVWLNRDSSTHTATSDASPPVWDTGEIPSGQTSSPVDFPTVGVFPYHCSIHLSMRAIIRAVVTRD